jgi:hypothetical protein
LDFLKQFPDVEIRYNARLHAKFYENDFNYIMTSLNLYDYSLAKNIEVGIIGHISSRGIVGKVVEGAGGLIAQGVEKVGQDVFGIGQAVNPMEKFQAIFQESTLMYKTEPIRIDEIGIKGIIGRKKLDGFNVVIDNLSNPTEVVASNSTADVSNAEKEVKSTEGNSGPPKGTQSATQLSKKLGVQLADITRIMEQSGLIIGDKITPAGLAKGLVMKNYLGKDYIAYPESLSELHSLKNKAL